MSEGQQINAKPPAWWRNLSAKHEICLHERIGITGWLVPHGVGDRRETAT